jgi:hypothetical protein
VVSTLSRHRTPRVAPVVGVVTALLVGAALIAMHAMPALHHEAAPVVGPVAASAPMRAAPMAHGAVGSPGQQHAVGGDHTHDGHDTTTAPNAAALDAGHVLHLCVAIVVSALAVLLALLRRGRIEVRLHVPPWRTPRVRRVRAPPTPALAELCVLRC